MFTQSTSFLDIKSYRLACGIVSILWRHPACNACLIPAVVGVGLQSGQINIVTTRVKCCQDAVNLESGLWQEELLCRESTCNVVKLQLGWVMSAWVV